MLRPLRASIRPALFAVVLAACGSRNPPPVITGNTDVVVTPMDAHADVRDVTTDVLVDAPPDARDASVADAPDVSDARGDASVDASDAMSDAPDVTDAGPIVCDFSADAAMRCPSGLTCCGGLCVDLDNDNANCGTCNHACPSGQACGITAPRTCDCTGGLALCDGACIDPVLFKTDESNCGTCGTVCDPGSTCTEGHCAPTCATDADCAAGESCCAGFCADLTVNDVNCGACGQTCPAAEHCGVIRAAHCDCPSGTTFCQDRCVAPTAFADDNANCGYCGNACPSGSVCTSGICKNGNTPVQGSARCMGDLDCTDFSGGGDGGTAYCCNGACAVGGLPLECGGCGVQCRDPLAVCNGVLCGCNAAAGMESCNGRCVATASYQSDVLNCGSCGNACASGETCEAGVCTPPPDAGADDASADGASTDDAGGDS